MSARPRGSRAFALCVLASLLVAPGCAQDGRALVDEMLDGSNDDGGPMNDGNPMANLVYIQTNIFEVYCTDCHTAAGIAPFLQLESQEASCANLVGKTSALSPPLLLVAPGDPDSSVIVQRIEGIIQPQMPLDKPPLEAANRQAIKDWIKKGADCGLP